MATFIRCLVVLALLSPAKLLAEELPAPTQRLLQSAYSQVGQTVSYDPGYSVISFPGGDVPIERGVCTDVVIRAYRGIGLDLQLLVNQDMRKAFHAYPKQWGLSHPDTNIDHRRVPNLAVFFSRHGQVLPITKEARDYKPGDIVTWKLPNGHPHIGLVSDRRDGDRPLMIHNIGAGARVDDVLFAFAINGHYRFRLDGDSKH